MSIYNYLFAMCLLGKAILFSIFFNVISLFIERISSLYRGYQWEKLHKLKKKYYSFYIFYKTIIFPYFLKFFLYNSKNKGERQKWISDSDSTSKNSQINKKKHFFYMTFKRQ